MPTCLAIGQAAGTAAALAIREGCPVSAVEVAALRKELVQDGAVVSLP